jgi:hypothetical protein
MNHTRRYLYVVFGSMILSVTLMRGDLHEVWGEDPQRLQALKEEGSAVPIKGEVQVLNTLDDPVPVENVREQEPFQTSVALNLPRGVQSPSLAIDLARGKRLVVKYISAFVSLPRGEKATLILNAPFGRGNTPQFFFPLTLTGLPSVLETQYAVSQETLVFAEERLSIVVFRNLTGDDGSGMATATISGYLVDIS